MLENLTKVQILSLYLPHVLRFYGASSIFKMLGLKPDGTVLLTDALGSHFVDVEMVGSEYVPILKPLVEDIDLKTLTWEKARELASGHYDIFGWIAEGKAENFYDFYQIP